MKLHYGILTLAVSLAVGACTSTNSTWHDTRGTEDTYGRQYNDKNRVVSDSSSIEMRSSAINPTPAPIASSARDVDAMHQPLRDNPQSPGAGNQRELSANLSANDRQFIITAMAGGQYEVNSSDKAGTHSSSVQIKTLAQHMIDDHNKANQQLKDLASRKGFTSPVGVTTDQIAMLARLDKLNGADFDAEYLRQQKQAHEDTIAAFQNESTRGDDKDVRDWASATLPSLRNHLDMVNALNANNTNVGMAH